MKVKVWILKKLRKSKGLYRWQTSNTKDGEPLAIITSKIDYLFEVGNQYPLELERDGEDYAIQPEDAPSTIVEEEEELVKVIEEEEPKKFYQLSSEDLWGKEPMAEEVDAFVEEQENNNKKTRHLSNKLELVVPDESKLQLTLDNVRNYHCRLATDQEIYIFMQKCINQGLNPFIGDAYLIKYSKTDKAQMVVSKDAFLKKAEQIEDYRGFKAGIVLILEDKTIDRREGSLKLKEEQLIGGWAKIFRNGMEIFLAEVSFEEYNTNKSTWRKMPSTMIRKVAIVQALREAFPQNFQGMYDVAEIDVEKS